MGSKIPEMFGQRSFQEGLTGEGPFELDLLIINRNTFVLFFFAFLSCSECSKCADLFWLFELLEAGTLSVKLEITGNLGLGRRYYKILTVLLALC